MALWAGTEWVGISTLWKGEIANLICNICHSLATLQLSKQIRLFLYILFLGRHANKQLADRQALGPEHSLQVCLHNNNNNRIQRRYSRFFTISSQCRKLSPTCTLKWPRRSCVQITCNTSSAYHVQHVVLRATWYKGTAQLLSLTELKSHLFELYFVSWIIKPMKEGRKPEYPEKPPGDKLQKMPHTTARRFKSQARLEPAQ